MVIAVDFDGTCVEHKYPEVGGDVIGAEATLKDLVARGDQLILWTMRSGPALEDAVNWFNDRGIPLWGINTNRDQAEWTESPKAYAHLYIDDAAFGAPLDSYVKIEADGNHQVLGRPWLNWAKVREVLFND